MERSATVGRSLLVKIAKTLVFLLLTLFAPGLWAQDSAAYVSRLTAQPGPQSVVLTWKDAEGFKGAHYEVWRLDKEIMKDNLSQAKLLATVAAGVEAYEDNTVLVPSFYLVLLKDASGARKSYFIPFRNKTTTAVKPGGVTSAPARIQVGPVTYANPQVVVSFQAVPPDRKLLVFRRASAIADLAGLKDATMLGTTSGAQAPYRDTPPPGLEFYYAVVDAQAWADGRADVFQPVNATATPVGFPLVALPPAVADESLDSKLRPDLPSTRALPLPQLQVGTEPDSGAPLVSSAYQPVAARDLPPDADAALRRWSKASVAGGATLPAPVRLPEERAASEDGAGRYLVQIQAAYIDPKDWKGALAALETFLRLPLDDKTEARGRFYLGEVWANLQNYRQAFVEFLAARDSYPAETNPFLEALFSLLETSPN